MTNGTVFPESVHSISNLPVLAPNELCKVVPPETPDVLAYYYTLSGKTKTICMVTDVKCNVTGNGLGGFNLEVIFSGTKEYDSDGVTSDSKCRFRLKLYKDNQVIDSKSVFTPYIYTGESFSNIKETFYNLEEGTYELILTDY